MAWIGSLAESSAAVCFQNFFAAAADVDGGSEFEEACGHAFAEAGASAGDEDALVVEKVGAEHECIASRVLKPIIFDSVRGAEASLLYHSCYKQSTLAQTIHDCHKQSSSATSNPNLCCNGLDERKCYAEAVVGILEFWRDAGAGGAAGYFDVVAPGASAGGFA